MCDSPLLVACTSARWAASTLSLQTGGQAVGTLGWLAGSGGGGGAAVLKLAAPLGRSVNSMRRRSAGTGGKPTWVAAAPLLGAPAGHALRSPQRRWRCGRGAPQPCWAAG